MQAILWDETEAIQPWHAFKIQIEACIHVPPEAILISVPRRAKFALPAESIAYHENADVSWDGNIVKFPCVFAIALI